MDFYLAKAAIAAMGGGGGSGDFPEIFYKLDLTEIPTWSVTAYRHNLAADISWPPLI